MVDILARYASRFRFARSILPSIRALLWVGVALAIVAAVILAFVPRLPADTSGALLALSTAASPLLGPEQQESPAYLVVTRIAASFVLLAGTSMLLTTLIALQRTQTGMDTRHVLTINVPAVFYGKTGRQVVDFYKEVIRRINALRHRRCQCDRFRDGRPWRDAGSGPTMQFGGDGHVRAAAEEDPRTQFRVISPGFFSALGVPHYCWARLQ